MEPQSNGGSNKSKQDILWGYFAQFFSIASGLIILPMILRYLSPEEIGMNYLILSVGAFVTLVDFGFSTQFGLNVTYIYSGVQQLLKKGLAERNCSNNKGINYKLLATLIQTARWVYSVMASFVLLVMLTGGSYYIFHITGGFNNVSNSLLIWIVYSCGIFFQIYYSYYNALLIGSGKIMENKKTIVYSNILKIGLTYSFLLLDYGLLGVVVANFISPFFSRYLYSHYYFTSDLITYITPYRITFLEIKDLFKVLWCNSRKMGVIAMLGYMTHGVPMLLAGIYLSLNEIASYGLMIQFVGLISGISNMLFTTHIPRFGSLRILNKMELLKKEMAYAMGIFYILFIVGILVLIFLVPVIIQIVGSQTMLPSAMILFCCSLFKMFDNNFANLCQIFITGNDFPFLKSCLFTGFAIIIGCYLLLAYFQLGIWSIVLSIGISQTMWNNWYWPHLTMKKMHTNCLSFLKEGYLEIKNRIKY